MTEVKSSNSERVHLHLKARTSTEAIVYTVNSGDATVAETGESPITGTIDNANPMLVSGADGVTSITARSGNDVEEFTYTVATATAGGFDVTQDAPEPKEVSGAFRRRN